MAEGKKPQQGDVDGILASLIVEGAELWQWADQFAHSLPIHMGLLSDALRKLSFDQSRQVATLFQSVATSARPGIMRSAHVIDLADQCVMADLAESMDDLTATILRVQTQLQNEASQ